MTEKLTELLKTKSTENHCDNLYAQWMLNKESLSKVLAQISTIYPHYSMHDISHSNSIINNIVYIIGYEVIEQKFSATDLWLLLSAAYYHDIGMALSGDDISNTLTDPNFGNHIERIQEDRSHPLYSNANEIKTTNQTDTYELQWTQNEITYKTLNCFRYLLGDFYRSKHGQRSADHIKDWYIGNTIPGNIPKRLWLVMAQICESHTLNFEKVMELAYSENGFNTDYAHPRFIACLLRLGDLLDLDNNRFDIASLNTIGEMPFDSKCHFEKHLSIDRFNITNKEIEIHAQIHPSSSKGEKEDLECVYEVARITQDWFDWIEKEIIDQTTKWNLIVPTEYPITLPTIKSLKVEITEYIYLNKQEKPCFKIDTKQAFELLKGLNLYKSPWLAIRELIQNAIDTTLIRVWEDYPDEEITGYIINKYPIEISISAPLDNPNISISIKDSGMGISKEDLKYLIHVGSSKQNSTKEKRTKNMPRNMKPSGTFGIGFQSIFMITDKVTIETKSYDDRESLTIKFYSPNGPQKGNILIKPEKEKRSQKPFTRIEFDIEKADLISTHPELSRNEERLIGEFDPFNAECNEFGINYLVKQIVMCTSRCPFKVIFTVDGRTIGLPAKDGNQIEYEGDGFNLKFKITDRFSGYTDIFFKHQYVETIEQLSYPFIDLEFNILGDDANSWLTIDRSSIKKEKIKELNKVILSSFYQLIDKNDDISKIFSVIDVEDQAKAQIQFSLFSYAFIPTIITSANKRMKLLKDFDVQWKKYRIPEIDITFEKLIEACSLLKVSLDQKTLIKSMVWNQEEGTLELPEKPQKSDDYFLYVMIIMILKERLNLVEYKDNHIVFSKGENGIAPSKNFEIKAELEDIATYINQKEGNHRYLIPCTKEYRDLALIAIPDVGLVDSFLPYDLDSICTNLMISPFVKQTDNNTEALYNFVFKNRSQNQEETSKHDDQLSEIRKVYTNFVKEINHLKAE